MLSITFKATLGLLAFNCATGVNAKSYASSLESNAKQLFTESMTWMDTKYDRSVNYLYDFTKSTGTALRHETRSSVWYAFGLLARNEDDDAKQAEKIITNVIHGQYKVESEQW